MTEAKQHRRYCFNKDEQSAMNHETDNGLTELPAAHGGKNGLAVLWMKKVTQEMIMIKKAIQVRSLTDNIAIVER